MKHEIDRIRPLSLARERSDGAGEPPSLSGRRLMPRLPFGLQLRHFIPNRRGGQYVQAESRIPGGS